MFSKILAILSVCFSNTIQKTIGDYPYHKLYPPIIVIYEFSKLLEKNFGFVRYFRLTKSSVENLKDKNDGQPVPKIFAMIIKQCLFNCIFAANI